MIVMGPRELIYYLLSKFHRVPIDLVRQYAVKHLDECYIPGTFIPITANGQLSYRCLEDVLLDMHLIGEITIEDGIVTLNK